MSQYECRVWFFFEDVSEWVRSESGRCRHHSGCGNFLYLQLNLWLFLSGSFHNKVSAAVCVSLLDETAFFGFVKKKKPRKAAKSLCLEDVGKIVSVSHHGGETSTRDEAVGCSRSRCHLRGVVCGACLGRGSVLSRSIRPLLCFRQVSFNFIN